MILVGRLATFGEPAGDLGSHIGQTRWKPPFFRKCRFFEISVLTESWVGLRGPLTAADHTVLVRSPRHYGQHAPQSQEAGIAGCPGFL
ncbi:hypothetical protein, partial [Novosphingobium sp. ZW T3_23]|uniref:hypothetical protein n=1 Tax=Novosphingobium sp. ZW T3_23 TaxID=3378084 RepID=UPI003852A6EC